MANVSRTTVKQILEDIQVRLPHEYKKESLFLWINETMKKIYKDLALQDCYSFITSAGQNVYSLPENCSIDMITSVTISNKPRTPENQYDWGGFSEIRSYIPDEKMTVSGYYDATEGTIGIYPVPQDARKVFVYYLKKPKMITDENDYIELDDNFVDLIKYNVMSIIAMSGYNPDVELANEYILLYNNLVLKANESKNEQQQRYPIIRNVNGIKLKRRRR